MAAVIVERVINVCHFQLCHPLKSIEKSRNINNTLNHSYRESQGRKSLLHHYLGFLSPFIRSFTTASMFCLRSGSSKEFGWIKTLLARYTVLAA